MNLVLCDLFCGAGGASEGYRRAGFDVVGVDIEPMPHYPFKFIQMDALAYLDAPGMFRYIKANFAAIHASPPCQAWSDLQKQSKIVYQDFIGPVRERLEAIGLPYIIENVEGAPLRDPVWLCGASDAFPELRVIRHRQFETNWPLRGAECPQKHPLVFTYDKRKPHYGKLDQNTAYVQVTGGGNCTVANARDAMGIDWMTKMELNEAIPPAYTEYIGRQLQAHLETAGNYLSPNGEIG